MHNRKINFTLKSGIIKKILDGDLLPTINLNTEYRKLVSIQAKPVKTHKDLALVCSITNRYHEIPKETILIELLNKFTKNKWSLVNKPVGRKDKYRAIRFMQYSHFAMVDTPYLATGGSFKKELHSMFSSKKYFNMTKRLRAGDKYRSYTKFRQHLEPIRKIIRSLKMLCDMTKGQSLFFLTRDAFLEGLNRNMNFTPTFRIGS